MKRKLRDQVVRFLKRKGAFVWTRDATVTVNADVFAIWQGTPVAIKLAPYGGMRAKDLSFTWGFTQAGGIGMAVDSIGMLKRLLTAQPKAERSCAMATKKTKAKAKAKTKAKAKKSKI